MKNFLWQLSLINRGSRRITLLAHLGLTLGCALIFFLFLLGKSGAEYLQDHVLGQAPEQELKIGLKTKDIAFFQVQEPGSRSAIKPEDIETVKQMEDVRGVFPISFGNQATSMYINYMGRSFQTEMVVQGIDPQWVGSDKLAWEPGQTVPVLVNSQILAIYNNGYAKTQNLPKLSASALMMPTWDLIYDNRKDSRPPLRLKAKVVGFSPKVDLGAVVPQNVLDYMHQELGLAPVPKTQMVLALDPQTEMDTLRQKISDLGFAIDEPNPLVRLFQQVKSIGFLATFVLLVCVLFFGFAYLNQTLKMLFVLKQHDYAICRAMGMSRTRLQLLLFGEAMGMVSLDIGLGGVLGYGGLSWLNEQYISNYLNQMIGIPLSIHVPYEGLAITMACILFISLWILMPRVFFATKNNVKSFLNV